MAETGVVYVIDDDPSLCELIQSSLTHAGLKVRCFLSAEAFAGSNPCAEAADLPCCMLLDVVMPGISGLEFLEKHWGGEAPFPVIIISARGSIRTAVKSMQLGAVDFLEKPFSTEALVELVLRTLQKHPADCQAARDRVAIRARIARLSPRERELLDGIVRGNSTKVIADRLQISARTIDHHRANMMEKMRAGNVADLVRMAMQADYSKVKPSSTRDTPAAPATPSA
jgi:two-component system, LuxR family, response regulator FixJ